jgi:hypothetical protein
MAAVVVEAQRELSDAAPHRPFLYARAAAHQHENF